MSHGALTVLLVIVVHQFDDHFGIGLAVERIAMLQQLILQLLIVFDDTIMDTDHLGLHLTRARTCAVAGYMRMRICDAGLSMRCPTGVTVVVKLFCNTFG